jgi:hypothetical protein
MASSSNDKPVWEGFALLGLRLTRSVTEIADTQVKRIEQEVTARADEFYARREVTEEPKRRAIHLIGSLFDEVMDRLRKDDDGEE